MQAIKEKLHDMSTLRQAKAEAKEEEKAEKERAKARMEEAHEMKLAREKEAEMNLHVAKVVDEVAPNDAKSATDDQDAEHPPSATILSAEGNPIYR